ncbi:LTA synthase family protein [Loigolactobacillus backii]|uniref:Alkaline phosphatase n=1 Tax=Loigolactobacillus backii TaxID=375175 RepID=A0A192H4R7_9LACO|nr:LTA synthase family protein [Loigolactobacillus backii]ANK59900.1 alkaline phosphatase [Loigolactobacillus backii]ANK63238.1 alkaline phosphatase [Loigolactobacillus backii]ANK64834.1 alkaline phosphatase [Loigolactobacillus backii]ANK66719.1 alkaline phosphatase [Loigolactobacillus backii]ANK69756.1 alkaline phosphatase [Loigolactobacillus backii]
MKSILKSQFWKRRSGFFVLVVGLFWLKTIIAYYLDFSLGISGIFQHLILWLNPIATTLLLFGLALYIKRPWLSYVTLLLIDTANTALLYFNIIYYRQFTDFMTINTMLGYSKVSEGLSGSSLALASPHDFIYWIDIIILAVLLLARLIKPDKRPVSRRLPLAITSVAVLLFSINLTLGEADRPQLLSRTFDRNYIVKYLGLDAFTVYDAVKTAQNNQVRASADSADLDSVLNFINQHYAAPNPKMYGIAKGKNVIVIHLESFQQFLIDDKVNGETVTPFLNSLYHDNQTYSFSNFFHQVGQGKTSDAENMLETGVYGLPQGSVFTALGSDNTFQAAPAILKQQAGYTSAVFHGNVGSFWNRNNVYKNFGYDNFYDASYFDTTGDRSEQYGLKDKLLFQGSIKYLEQLQQPFYAKFLTVTNHFPFPLDKEDGNFPIPNTGDKAVDNYFATAHYLDQSVHEFFNYLKASGLYDKSIIILYGDHYGISNSDNLSLAPLLGKSADTWNDYDNAQLQRVPFMIHIPGQHNGGIQPQYGGEIDVLPTLEHLLGINNRGYVQFGTDLFSAKHDQVVPFRNSNFVTPDYTVVDDSIYKNSDGSLVTHPSTALKQQIAKDQTKVQKELQLSDTVNNKNLLRFYTPAGFTPVNPEDYNYHNDFAKAKKIRDQLGNKSTSLFSKNNDQSTSDLYKTDAPELDHHDVSADNDSQSDSTSGSSYQDFFSGSGN